MTIEIRLGDYSRVIPAQANIDLIFTSPPYNIGSKAPRQDGRRRNGGYDPKSYGGIIGYVDSLPEDEYQDQQVSFLSWAAHALKDDGVLVYNHKPRRKDGVMIHPMQWLLRCNELTLMEEIIWDRCSTHNHANRLFWPTTERLYVFRKSEGSYRFVNNGDLEFRDDHWVIPLNSSRATQEGHACPFGDRLAQAVVKAFSKQGELVCDPYSGSGATAIAAKTLSRSFIGAEISENYWRHSLARLANKRFSAHLMQGNDQLQVL